MTETCAPQPLPSDQAVENRPGGQIGLSGGQQLAQGLNDPLLAGTSLLQTIRSRVIRSVMSIALLAFAQGWG
jgi:hypothetical protein